MENPLTRFSATVEDYRRFRPSYPKALIDWITKTAGITAPARVLDVGCGTGIVSRLFTERGFQVVGVDPNADMLAVACAEGGGAAFIRARAEATGLADGTCDLAVAGQAYHWFDLASAHLPAVARMIRFGSPTLCVSPGVLSAGRCHAHIGDGECGESCFATILQRKAFTRLPKILETPKDVDSEGQAWDLVNIARLKRLATRTVSEISR